MVVAIISIVVGVVAIYYIFSAWTQDRAFQLFFHGLMSAFLITYGVSYLIHHNAAF